MSYKAISLLRQEMSRAHAKAVAQGWAGRDGEEIKAFAYYLNSIK